MQRSRITTIDTFPKYQRYGEDMKMHRKLLALDLFSGAGGLTEGFARNKFDIIAHVEKDYWACETLRTRLLFHELEAQGNLDPYWSYCSQRRDQRLKAMDRSMLINAIGLERANLILDCVIQETFGIPENPPGAVSAEMVIEIIQKKYPIVDRVDLIIGGPPCQAYSLVGRGRMKENALSDSRNYLFRYYVQMVDKYKPEIFIMENVPGIITAHQGAILSSIRSDFKDIGYEFYTGMNKDDKDNVLDARDYGVPQKRKRMIMIGAKSRSRLPMDIYRTLYSKRYPESSLMNGENISTIDVIGDLPVIQNGQGVNNLDEYPVLTMHPSKYQTQMRNSSNGVMNHIARPHSPNDLAIYRIAIDESLKGNKINYCDYPEEYRTHKNLASFADRYKVHTGEATPHTIVAHLSKDGHYNIHPDITQCRSFTVREAARVQSFPDNYKFEGPRTAQYVQVGNAVPPLLSQAIANAVLQVFGEYGLLDEHC
jgi:DNA (cytosine-5)-methyltransferase 1